MQLGAPVVGKVVGQGAALHGQGARVYAAPTSEGHTTPKQLRGVVGDGAVKQLGPWVCVWGEGRGGGKAG